MSPIGTHLGILAQSVALPTAFENDQSFTLNGGRFRSNALASVAAGGNTWAYSLWFKIPASNTGTLSFIGAGGSVVSSSDVFIAIRNTGVYIVCEISEGTSNNDKDQIWTWNTGAYRDGNWHHLYFLADGYTNDANDLHLYIDGVEVGTILRNNQDSTAWGKISDVIYLTPTNGSINDCVDEIALFDYDPGVANVYNSGCPGDLSTLPTAPVSWFRGEGDLTDSGSNAETVTEINPVTYSNDTPC